MAHDIQFTFVPPSTTSANARWLLPEDAVVASNPPGTFRYEIPRWYDGFNGASVPAALWVVYGHPMSKHLVRAALVHDAAYQEPSLRTPLGLDTRRKADRAFQAIAREDGLGRFKAAQMFLALDAAGERYWQAEGPVPLEHELEAVALIKKAWSDAGLGFVNGAVEKGLLTAPVGSAILSTDHRGLSEATCEAIEARSEDHRALWATLDPDDEDPHFDAVEALQTFDASATVDWDTVSAIIRMQHGS